MHKKILSIILVLGLAIGTIGCFGCFGESEQEGYQSEPPYRSGDLIDTFIYRGLFDDQLEN